ncbi:MAG: ergothioneine biosynthesis protein EgtC [Sporichthyaceae bacterium]
MCRHFAYLGPPVSLHDIVFAPPFGLARQSYAPRRQAYGLLNADGFGLGWYREGQAEPARYRRAMPIWGDVTIKDLAAMTRSHAILGAVRSASPGNVINEPATAPFTAGRWLFSHNGTLTGWPASAEKLAAEVPWTALAGEQALIDSTLLWALLRTAFDRGEDPVAATAALAARARAITGGRANLLLHDGERIIATTAGDTLCYLHGAHPGPDGMPVPGVIVASEPFDDTDGWVDIPDGHVLVATAADITIEPLPQENA